MHVPQSLLTMSPFFVDVCLAFTWKMMWHTAWVFRKILRKWPHSSKCKHMQSCSRDLSLFSSKGGLQSQTTIITTRFSRLRKTESIGIGLTRRIRVYHQIEFFKLLWITSMVAQIWEIDLGHFAPSFLHQNCG